MTDWLDVTDEEREQIVTQLEIEMADKCYICEKSEHSFIRQVNECQNCERLVCQDCAEVDYDMQGDPPHYVNTQWICDSLKGGCQPVAEMEAVCG